MKQGRVETMQVNQVADEGASAVEYGLIVFAIAAVIAAVLFSFGLVVRDTYEGTCDDLAAQTSQPDC